MEENMEAVGSILGNLKNMAVDMEKEIDRQLPQIERLNAKVALLLLFKFYFLVMFCFIIFSVGGENVFCFTHFECFVKHWKVLIPNNICIFIKHN